ncbi:MAG: MlaD family protein [Cytophagales bacterium]
MKISKEVKVGLLAIISGVMLYSGFNFLKGTDFFSSIKRYHILYENVGGIKVSTPVMIKGLNVGRVERMISLPENGFKTEVIIQVDKSYQLTSECHADIVELGLLDGKAIELVMSEKGTKLEDGAQLNGFIQEGMVSAAGKKFAPLIANVDTSLNSVKEKLRDIDSKKIDKILGNLDLASQELVVTVKTSRASISQLSGSITQKLEALEKDLHSVTASLKTMADSVNKAHLAQTIDNANKTLGETKDLFARMNKGEGTLGKLSKNDSLYNNLNSAVADLDKLLIDLNKNPKRYVHFSLFGKKDKKETKENK